MKRLPTADTMARLRRLALHFALGYGKYLAARLSRDVVCCDINIVHSLMQNFKADGLALPSP